MIITETTHRILINGSRWEVDSLLQALPQSRPSEFAGFETQLKSLGIQPASPKSPLITRCSDEQLIGASGNLDAIVRISSQAGLRFEVRGLKRRTAGCAPEEIPGDLLTCPVSESEAKIITQWVTRGNGIIKAERNAVRLLTGAICFLVRNLGTRCLLLVRDQATATVVVREMRLLAPSLTVQCFITRVVDKHTQVIVGCPKHLNRAFDRLNKHAWFSSFGAVTALEVSQFCSRRYDRLFLSTEADLRFGTTGSVDHLEKKVDTVHVTGIFGPIWKPEGDHKECPLRNDNSIVPDCAHPVQRPLAGLCEKNVDTSKPRLARSLRPGAVNPVVTSEEVRASTNFRSPAVALSLPNKVAVGDRFTS